MASFRKSSSKAEHAVQVAHASEKSIGKKGIPSDGSQRIYSDHLKLANDWMIYNGNRLGIDAMTTDHALAYLNERREYVCKSTLSQDRKALQLLPNVDNKLPIIKSQLGDGKLSQESRAYTSEQIQLLRTHQPEHHSFSTEIAEVSGIRGLELLTLQPANERPASSHRVWSEKRFTGRTGIRYTVRGKGGLIREILIPHHLSIKLEQLRLDEPLWVRDRKIYHKQYYALGGGQAWAMNFSKNSTRMLGWSKGSHGTRHTFAQRRMNELQSFGFIYKDALLIVSQEMGHFRPCITEVYLR